MAVVMTTVDEFGNTTNHMDDCITYDPVEIQKILDYIGSL